MVGCTSVYHGTDRILKSLDSYYKDGNQVRTVKLHFGWRYSTKRFKIYS